jgi:hypothetical protein
MKTNSNRFWAEERINIFLSTVHILYYEDKNWNKLFSSISCILLALTFKISPLLRKEGKMLTFAFTNLQRLAKIITKIPKNEISLEKLAIFLAKTRFREISKHLNML